MAPQETSNAIWPKSACAAVALTLDNMGEAADLNRGLWPASQPVGAHYSVTQVLPQMLSLLAKYNISVTYFIESWNLQVYGDFILNQIASAGHEIGWHGWQHEAWSGLEDERAERENFEKSFGKDGIGGFTGPGAKGAGKVEKYRGFRPPGGLIHGSRTLNLCTEYGLRYLSPAANEAAIVSSEEGKDFVVILPFKWATVDAYYYMDSFAGLRRKKAEYPVESQSPDVLVERFKKEVDLAIERRGYVSLLFHPFLTNQPERLDAMERVLKYLVEKRDKGIIWLARNREIDEWVREHPSLLGDDPQWDQDQW
ncbi:MAG: hypothetical protein Q9165_005317 [Trypethelium subeluteriae]